MNKKIKENLKEALVELNKENENLLVEGKYAQVSKNASTITKIAEALSSDQVTNIRL